MTRKVPPTDPIRRPRRDFEPGPEWPVWLERVVGWLVAVSLLVGLALLATVIWALVEVTQFVIRTR
jgi:hypothetical protein